MADTYNQNKHGLKVSKSSLTRAIGFGEESCEHLAKAPKDASSATKVILSTAVVEALEPITEKQKKVSTFREATMNSIVQFGADEFQTSKRMR